jgi:hypothetical protein
MKIEKRKHIISSKGYTYKLRNRYKPFDNILSAKTGI